MANLYPWLTPIYHHITAAFQQGHGHHALLFKADEGLGAETLVRATAQFLLCRASQQVEKPCEQCHACYLFRAGNHPDFHVLASVDNKDIGVDQVREINEIISRHAQQGGNKVVHLQGAERLTEAAANALLKTLEEPPENTYFLLQTDVNASLLATIYSRCQAWMITVPSQEVALAWLRAQSSIALSEQKTDEISTALRINYGRPLLARQALEQGLIAKRHEFLRAFWLFYQRRSPLELLPMFDKSLILQQTEWMAAFLADALKDKLDIRDGWQCQDLVRGVRQFSEKQSVQGLLKANEIMRQVRSDLTRITAANQELILLDGLTRLITDVFEK
ncbi:DNA polymerase III subunit delta' [Actinobacillus succinogenes]|uniref:DNA polymerase III subunit delta' n=1 Tax=Actinobacillus succinogenes (strain ATCC 55618 / DSM 22257 / CCUG 43843 / 130Z) TaxID=339671 RepID=A6VQH0_ACTSZ|nr:DNA polymerase III subunit delta' [Actinobacillus succinogenes]ABR75217.1 DNA polymerase III, delta prime subunit [Actinobacillus succinogenes 130Z]PHI40390.1 DNA polymerase III subunit delta' [Actinobacillus succinogenes]